MAKRALLVGIDHYENQPQLGGCVADAIEMRRLLQTHHDGSQNFDCRALVSSPTFPVTRQVLRKSWHELFDDFSGDIVFHFSGHGSSTATGGCLVTHDATRSDPGLAMDDLLALANRSHASSVLLIIDACHAGELGDPAILQHDGAVQTAYIRHGVTILAAAGTRERAREASGMGVFTGLVLGALAGGAADVRGRVSAAAIYAYAEQALSSWEQRPLYKSYAESLPPVRRCKPAVQDALLRQLPKMFAAPHSKLSLAPSFEFTHPSARPHHVALYNKLKILRNAGLLRTQAGRDLYFVALGSGWVRLTPLGEFYWRLASSGRLGNEDL
jgi:hypothetical protein